MGLEVQPLPYVHCWETVKLNLDHCQLMLSHFLIFKEKKIYLCVTFTAVVRTSVYFRSSIESGPKKQLHPGLAQKASEFIRVTPRSKGEPDHCFTTKPTSVMGGLSDMGGTPLPWGPNTPCKQLSQPTGLLLSLQLLLCATLGRDLATL